jgi:hypothetical protein
VPAEIPEMRIEVIEKPSPTNAASPVLAGILTVFCAPDFSVTTTVADSILNPSASTCTPFLISGDRSEHVIVSEPDAGVQFAI